MKDAIVIVLLVLVMLQISVLLVRQQINLSQFQGEHAQPVVQIVLHVRAVQQINVLLA